MCACVCVSVLVLFIILGISAYHYTWDWLGHIGKFRNFCYALKPALPAEKKSKLLLVLCYFALNCANFF